MKQFWLWFIYIIFIGVISAQSNFKTGLKNSNPVDLKIDIPIDSAISIHKNYLQNAKNKKDTLRQLYGHFYLYVDYYKKDDYASVQKHFLEASNLVNEASNPAWKAAICMRKAHMIELIDADIPAAITQYEKAINYCKIAKDSFCIAECLEQLSNLNSSIGNYEIAETYFDEAIVWMRKFGGMAEMALAYNNYSILLSNQGKLKESIVYIDSAIMIAVEKKDLYKEMMYKSNLAAKYTLMNMPKKAIDIYKQCIITNTQNQWYDLLRYNYSGIADAYEKTGNLAKTNEFTHNYYLLNDSINGAEVKLKISQLETENEINKRELLLEKNAKELAVISAKNIRNFWMMLSAFALSAFAFLLWISQKKKHKMDNLQNKKYLTDLTTIILKKNLLISSQNEELEKSKLKSDLIDNNDLEAVDIEDQIFNTKILNDDDYHTFKAYFEKAYPGYLLKIRKNWRDITAAEERLFLLIKLKLKNKDIADILGISATSVKKTRNRLRKKLNLPEDLELETFVDEF